MCGVPRNTKGGRTLKLDEASTFKVASRAVKTVYQHVSSPRDAQFRQQREALAQQFRIEHNSGTASEPNEYPFFVGVFDTVAALSSRGSLFVVAAVYIVILLAASWALGQISQNFSYWVFWLILNTVCLLIALYIYTHLKFSFRLEVIWFPVVADSTSYDFFVRNFMTPSSIRMWNIPAMPFQLMSAVLTSNVFRGAIVAHRLQRLGRSIDFNNCGSRATTPT